MATILLSAAGAALGGAFGGSVLGLSGAVIGRAVGATIGRVIDQQLLGSGSQVIETGRLQRYRVVGASEGSAQGQVYGRVRLGGQVIWSTKFKESSTTSGGGGKGGASAPQTKTYSYSVSLAVAVCEGEITRVGRIWADGIELELDQISYCVHHGTEDQDPDCTIVATEGAENAPAYRGTAYVVFENLGLGQFGNRVPQFSFEVIRATNPDLVPEYARSISGLVQGVALMPGSGEYALATTPVRFSNAVGQSQVLNVNAPGGKTDLLTSLEHLTEELPQCQSVALIVSWFGDDLRANSCKIQPKIEQRSQEGQPLAWSVNGETRETAAVVADLDGRPVYGGTPTDQSVIEAIQALHQSGQKVVFYPFILMDQMSENGLLDPYSTDPDQPHLPWRGRITTEVAPGRPGTSDTTVGADLEVAAFFGAAAPGDFTQTENGVGYTGPQEWSFRRFILHYAHLCAAAGGVDSFCIGSEMRGITQIRGAGNSFPSVDALIQLTQDVRAILGPNTKIGYAADWSEYFGYRPDDGSGDVFFHLDPLWADPNIDFIGIDNYMPLSDWRDGADHEDAHWSSIYNLDYLKSNVAGGEGYDWYYDPDTTDRDEQNRRPISDDTVHAEHWIYRYKDIAGWWSNPHHNRVNGTRSSTPTAWVPESKPIWFTEYGCAALDKATNQPNKFLDPKSSESKIPHYSNGVRDDLIQAQYLRAMIQYWSDPQNNPVSISYGGPMIDMSRAHVWAWDARPYPQFPGLLDLWSDGENYARGHWLNGRASHEALSAVVAEICARSGVTDFDVSRLYGLVRGYEVAEISDARAALQPLMLGFGFDAAERDGVLQFYMRDTRTDAVLSDQGVALSEDVDGRLEITRNPSVDTPDRIRLTYVLADGDFDVAAAEAAAPDEVHRSVSETELTLVLTRGEARRIVERWHAEARVARETLKFALPPSKLEIGPGDTVLFPEIGGGTGSQFRVDSVERSASMLCEAVRIEPSVYRPPEIVEEQTLPRPFQAAAPVLPLFLDLPLLTGDEVAHAPHVAIAAEPWPGAVAVYSANTDANYVNDLILEEASVVGQTQTALAAARPGLWDRGAELLIGVGNNVLESTTEEALLAGANALAIGDGSSDGWEVLQFKKAVMVSENTYRLSELLRGQVGTDALMPQEWPVGSMVVLLNQALVQLPLASSNRGVSRHYRIGPAHRSPDDDSYVYRIEAFQGIGLRPLSPVHLRARRVAGDLAVTWIRRTRLEGDSWDGEVPLGETAETYDIRVLSGGSVVQEATVASASWTYSAAEQAADGIAAPFEIEVAQVSDRFGPGPYARITIND